MAEGFGIRSLGRLLSREHQTFTTTATVSGELFHNYYCPSIAIDFLKKKETTKLMFRYIYNLLDFNALDNFFASEKPDLVSPPETHWDMWSSTLVDLVITSRIANKLK